MAQRQRIHLRPRRAHSFMTHRHHYKVAKSHDSPDTASIAIDRSGEKRSFRINYTCPADNDILTGRGRKAVRETHPFIPARSLTRAIDHEEWVTGIFMSLPSLVPPFCLILFLSLTTLVPPICPVST